MVRITDMVAEKIDRQQAKLGVQALGLAALIAALAIHRLTPRKDILALIVTVLGVIAIVLPQYAPKILEKLPTW